MLAGEIKAWKREIPVLFISILCLAGTSVRKQKGTPRENWMRDFHSSLACLFAFVKLLLFYTSH